MIPISFLLAIVISTSKSAFQAGMIIFVVRFVVWRCVFVPFVPFANEPRCAGWHFGSIDCQRAVFAEFDTHTRIV